MDMFDEARQIDTIIDLPCCSALIKGWSANAKNKAQEDISEHHLFTLLHYIRDTGMRPSRELCTAPLSAVLSKLANGRSS
ncbi:unnamed protein product, partial [Chrysoparadoxa australica]